MKWEEISNEDTNVIMHLYRGELQRINTWRERMDRTTNWSIVITVGVLTWALSSTRTPHWALLPGLFLVYMLLFTEARRYRYYDLWRGRVRALEQKFLWKFFDREVEPEKDWEKILSADLHTPRFKISWQEAVKRRLKRIYQWIILVFVASWIGKIYLHPEPISNLTEFFQRASVTGKVPIGILVIGVVIGSIVISTIYFFSAAPGRKATGEPRECKIDTKFATEEHIEEMKDEVNEMEKKSND